MRNLDKGFAPILIKDGEQTKWSIVSGYLFDSDVEDAQICVWKDEQRHCWKLDECNTGLFIGTYYKTRKQAIADFDKHFAERHAKLCKGTEYQKLCERLTDVCMDDSLYIGSDGND